MIGATELGVLGKEANPVSVKDLVLIRAHPDFQAFHRPWLVLEIKTCPKSSSIDLVESKTNPSLLNSLLYF